MLLDKQKEANPSMEFDADEKIIVHQYEEIFGEKKKSVTLQSFSSSKKRQMSAWNLMPMKF